MKLILNDVTTSVENLSSFLLVTDCFGSNHIYHPPYLLLGEKINLEDLKEIYIYSNIVNYNSINILTNYDFPNRLFHFFDIRIELFKEQLLKNGLPPREFDIARTDYINEFKPEIVIVKSKDDFAKLDTLKTNLNYLISIDLNLPIEDYLHLNQKINSLRKKQKINIRTELINL